MDMRRLVDRRVRVWIAKRVLAAPRPFRRALGRVRAREIDGQRLDPEMQLVVRLLERGSPPLDRLPVAVARREYERGPRVFEGAPIELPSVVDRTIPGPGGALPIRIYTPERRVVPPVLVYLHGGGGVIGSLATHDQLCRGLAKMGQTMVVSVGYRLAPQSPFPAAVEDACAAFAWVVAHARELDADPRRVGVGGDSMGGNLAAQVCLRARDEGGAAPVFQLLLYPVVDFAARTRSTRLFADGPLLTESLREWFHRQYLGGVDPTDPLASPLRRDDLSGLPPAFVATAAFDPLRDEGQDFVGRLQRAKVDVRSHCYAGLAHGCFNMTGAVTAAREALADVAREVRRAFARA